MWTKDLLKDNHKILAVAPMADMTDSAFCRTIKSVGGVDIMYREMVSSEAVVRDNAKTLGMTDFVDQERPIVQQIFGADPLTMAKAAEIVMQHAGPEGIDINMGCPVYKLTSNFNGAALMKDPDLSYKIVKEMKRALGPDVPLSVKIRLGWDDPDTFKTFIPVLEEAGADLIGMHGRTRAQAYGGSSDWERIRQGKEIATVPFLANGDIHKPSQVAEALEHTKCDGVLIARGVLGNPWFFKHVANPDYIVTPKERAEVAYSHAKLHVEHYGERGIMTFRKHLSWYFKSEKIGYIIPGIKDFRSKLVRTTSLEELKKLLDEYVAYCEEKGFK
jgi:tRNA-dihydrouridine synthase B